MEGAEDTPQSKRGKDESHLNPSEGFSVYRTCFPQEPEVPRGKGTRQETDAGAGRAGGGRGQAKKAHVSRAVSRAQAPGK